MKFLLIIMCLTTFGLLAQPSIVKESAQVTTQDRLDLEFAFASEIKFEVWDKKEVLVEVSVEINEGEDNDIFSLSSNTTSSTIYIEMDEDMWKKLPKEKNGDWNRCSYTSEITYNVYLPKNLMVKANTISGNYEFEYFGQRMDLNTISGAIDMTVPGRTGLDFKAKTISGEIFSDLEIAFPDGKDGLNQIVGQNIKGRVNDGGLVSKFETISGNIYLRRG